MSKSACDHQPSELIESVATMGVSPPPVPAAWVGGYMVARCLHPSCGVYSITDCFGSRRIEITEDEAMALAHPRRKSE